MIDLAADPGDLEELLLRLGVAALLGAVLGFERELKDKPLGLRTNMLVALGACSFGLITLDLVELFRGEPGPGNVDPSRVVQGIIEGIGFLGTAAIIRSRGDVTGTTTGATIWVVGAVGLACAFGLFVHAIAVTVIAFLVLSVLGAVERWFRRGEPGG